MPTWPSGSPMVSLRGEAGSVIGRVEYVPCYLDAVAQAAALAEASSLHDHLYRPDRLRDTGIDMICEGRAAKPKRMRRSMLYLGGFVLGKTHRFFLSPGF